MRDAFQIRLNVLFMRFAAGFVAGLGQLALAAALLYFGCDDIIVKCMPARVYIDQTQTETQ